MRRVFSVEKWTMTGQLEVFWVWCLCALVSWPSGELAWRCLWVESLQNMQKAVAPPFCYYIPSELELLPGLVKSLLSLVKSIYLRSLQCKQDISCSLNNIRVCLWSDAQKRIHPGCTLLPPWILLALITSVLILLLNSLSCLLNYRLS